MTNADKFKNIFGLYATELWSMPEKDFLKWLNSEVMNYSEIPNKWIPCSERLPEEKDAGILKKLGINRKSDYVLATVEAKGERMTVTTCTYDGAWYWNKKHVFPDFKVVAWKPLPEPYMEEVNGQ